MTRIALLGKGPSWSSLLRKCVVSLIKDAHVKQVSFCVLILLLYLLIIESNFRIM